MVYTEIFNVDCQIEVGRTQMENDKLVRFYKRGESSDNTEKTTVWFHLGDGYSSGHGFATILTSVYIARGQAYTECLRRVAVLVKNFSRRKNESSVPVVYTLITNVGLTSTPGLVTLKDAKKVYTVKI